MQIIQEVMTFLVPFIVGMLVDHFTGAIKRLREIIGK